MFLGVFQSHQLLIETASSQTWQVCARLASIRDLRAAILEASSFFGILGALVGCGCAMFPMYPGRAWTSRNGRFQVSMFIQYLFRCPWAGVLPDGETRWISQVSLHTIFLSPSS